MSDNVSFMRVIAAFRNRHRIWDKHDYNPQLLDMIVGTTQDIATALDEYAGIPQGFHDVLERHLGPASEYARHPSTSALSLFKQRMDQSPSVSQYLEHARSLQGVPSEYAQPLLNEM